MKPTLDFRLVLEGHGTAVWAGPFTNLGTSPMPRTITVRDECIALELDEQQLGILDRALKGFAKSLEAARDMGVITHETFCAKADRARVVQYLVYEAQEQFATAKRHQATPPASEEAPS